MSELLKGLMEDLSGFADEDAKIQHTVNIFDRSYCFGRFTMHDKSIVKFKVGRFSHAFYDKPEAHRRTATIKSEFCVHRASRVRWIGPVIAGQVPGVEVYAVPPNPKRLGTPIPHRLYVYWTQPYVVWIFDQSGFEFSTAYHTSAEQLRAKLKPEWSAKLIDVIKESPSPAAEEAASLETPKA